MRTIAIALVLTFQPPTLTSPGYQVRAGRHAPRVTANVSGKPP